MTRLLLIALLLGVALCGRCWGLEGRPFTPPLPVFADPFAFAVGGLEDLFVLEDLERRVLRVRIGGQGKPLPQGRRPRALALDPDGLLHVVDMLDPDQLGLRTYRAGRHLRSTPLRGEVMPAEPVAAAAGDGIVWLVDRSPPRLFLFAYDGAGLGWVDLQEVARAPFSVALGPAGEAFVGDPMGPAVLSFSPAGEYLGALDLGGTGVTRPTGVAADPGGRVWVSDGVTGHVVALDPAGEHSRLSHNGKLLRFRSPLRLAWRANALWVLEAGEGRVRVVELE